jgi:beta-glucanase (GH16 family)
MSIALGLAIVALQANLPAPSDLPASLDGAKLGPLDWEARSAEGMARAYYFGGDNHTLPGELERYIDPSYCAVPDPVTADPEGGFTITAREATPSDRSLCHLKPRELYVSGMVTSQHLFSSTYGYWAIRARLPGAPASWPAFWLLPTAKTAENHGAVPEIDILEEYAGVMHVMRQNAKTEADRDWKTDRTGFPISTLHLADSKVVTGGKTVHVDQKAWHTYGVLWEPTHLSFYVDDVRTWDVDIVISDPHYMIIDLAVDGRPYSASPNEGADGYPASMDVAWVRHYPLAKNESGGRPSDGPGSNGTGLAHDAANPTP